MAEASVKFSGAEGCHVSKLGRILRRHMRSTGITEKRSSDRRGERKRERERPRNDRLPVVPEAFRLGSEEA